MTALDSTLASKLIGAAASRLTDESDALSALDAVAGDGDHGVNMAAAFSDAVRRLSEEPPANLAEAFRSTSAAFHNTVGGASGALLGSFFSAAAKALEETEDPSASDVVNALDRGAARLVTVGSSKLGQKTMVDALLPAVAAAKSAAEDGADLGAAMSAAAHAASSGADATATMHPTAGRARYAPTESMGSPDPGATTIAHIFAAWAEVLNTEVAA
jgi:dihydroxyacetone kinase phosphoprotein-dependent L subunit